MSVTVNVNGVAISYPQTGDSEWGDEATDFAIQTGSALGKLGLSTGTSVDIPSTLDVTGATTLDSTLTVAGITTLNGNTNIGNANTDTIIVTGILNVDSGTLYVNPTDNRVGINDSSPSEALDVVGNALVSGSITGASAILTDLTVDTNLIKTNSTSNYVGINTTSPTVALDVTGDVKQSGVLFNSDGTVSAPSVAFTNDTNTGIYRIGSDNVGFTANGILVGEYGANGLRSSIGILSPTAIFQDKQTGGTSAQTITSGAWRTRRLNVSTYNNITGCSLSSNQIILPSGNYMFYGYAKIGDTSTSPVRSQMRLYNISDSSVIESGVNGYNNATAGSMGTTDSIIGYFTIASQKTIELQQQVQISTNGGLSINGTFTVTNEVYASIKIVKVG